MSENNDSAPKTDIEMAFAALRLAVREQTQAVRCVALALLYNDMKDNAKATAQLEEATRRLVEADNWADNSAIIAARIHAK